MGCQVSQKPRSGCPVSILDLLIHPVLADGDAGEQRRVCGGLRGLFEHPKDYKKTDEDG